MKKLFIPFLIPLCFLIFLRILFIPPTTLIHNFYKSYGFILSDKPQTCEKIKLPPSLTPVYESYNTVQKKAGLDISQYLGKTVKKYTYRVLNFPFETSSPVYANILIFKNKIIAADIMTKPLDGFLLSPADKIFETSS